MRARSIAFLTIQVASNVLAAPAPQASAEAAPVVPESELPVDLATPLLSGVPEDALQAMQDLDEAAFQQVQDSLIELEGEATTEKKKKKRGLFSGCTLSKVQIRREWSTFTKTERKAYTDAVLCLQSKPALTPAAIAAGAKSRFDDFVNVHIMQTMEIHYTGNFLSWHRYFVWLYEQALRNECGYKGSQPYWNWGLTAIIGLEKSPHFDGSAYSLSGNGAPVASGGDVVLGGGNGLPPILIPTGTGGGCVTSGPFANMSVNQGPVNLDSPGGTIISNPEGPFAYNPRCLKRDLTDAINRQYANASAILANIALPRNIEDFQLTMQGVPGSGNIGIHGGGHYSLGGDPGRDVFTSPGDPAFYLHHAMIDRVWYLWQALSPSTRARGTSAVAGTRTFMNSPPSDNTTIEDLVDIPYTGGEAKQIKDLLSTVSGSFCYVYL
ncbi:hypothetical protein B0T16DRAFT_385605 [Cercophora newfieldiana]|uniref:Tyrosinase copper-binding domain-containing protein n=1 Tax=Cercophora newfieldiana TaxID=92897 RepID=A0AA40D1P3_9PEZI|nr:hypothetical protein B0T16DRAFT_385605 [Cercophora newfieldiana]